MSQPGVQRKLAAILAADVAGYSRLMGDDEVGTAKALSGHVDAWQPIIASYGGRIVDTAGDGMLLEFPSIVAAVECAVAAQKLMAERNADVSQDRRMLYRIGINLGDVIVEGERILGDGVNVAARLESIAPPGGICLSDAAYQQVRGKVDVDFADMGEQRLKNIAQPVRVYVVSATIAQPIVPPAAPSARTPRLSIVVLPFANLGGDKEQDYFVDGITENLTTDLSRISGAFVIARNTAFTYKGKPADARQIGRELGVRYAMEGSVQSAHDRIRINAQLIDTETSAHLWAERFDKPRADLLDMQDEITARLASVLRVELTAAEARRAEQSPTRNPDSLDLVFRGRATFNRGLNPSNIVQAGRFFEEALALEPDNVEALVGLAAAKCSMATIFATPERATVLAVAEAAVVKALALAPRNADAHFVLGVIYLATKRPTLAVDECRETIALDRNHALAHAHIGAALILLGRAEETDHHIAHALRLSPRDPWAYLWCSTAGIAKCALGRYEEGIGWLRRSILANRSYPVAHFALAAALAQQGRSDEARAEIASGLILIPDFSIRRCREGAASDNPAYIIYFEDFIAGLRKAGLPEE